MSEENEQMKKLLTEWLELWNKSSTAIGVDAVDFDSLVKETKEFLAVES